MLRGINNGRRHRDTVIFEEVHVSRAVTAGHVDDSCSVPAPWRRRCHGHTRGTVRIWRVQ